MKKLYYLTQSEHLMNSDTGEAVSFNVLHLEWWKDLDAATELARLVIQKEFAYNMYKDNVTLMCDMDYITKERLMDTGVLYIRARNPNDENDNLYKDYYISLVEEKNFFLRLLATIDKWNIFNGFNINLKNLGGK